MGARNLFLLIAFSILPGFAKGAEPRIAPIIPQPVKMIIHNGQFTLSTQTVILVDDRTGSKGQYLAEFLLPAVGVKFASKPLANAKEHAGCIVMRVDAKHAHLGSEGYSLKVLKDRVHMVAPTPTGVFYACQALRQLLSPFTEKPAKPKSWTIPCVEIEDKPRFSWRGLMLDTGRVFYSPEVLKRYLDLMALYKLNRFHWHLTERVGWRIEIKKYPKLAKVCVHDTDASRKKLPEGKAVREYYTQKEIREIVAYAKKRHIMVIPEIEMPGHSGLAVGCYPDMLHCIRKDGKWSRKAGFLQGRIMCASSERTFEFLEGVLSEVADLFPAPWIHIGGEEPHTIVWSECSRCQAHRKAKDFGGVHDQYKYFIKRVESILHKKKKHILGWEEILGAKLAPGGAIQCWHGVNAGKTAAAGGIDVVMSPSSHCYFDASNGRTPTRKVYSFEPVPAGIANDKVKHILGVEAPMWMDAWRSWQYRPRAGTVARVDAQVFPRLIALAEVGWTPKDLRNWENFKIRVQNHGERLQRLGVAYHRDGGIWKR